MLCPKCGKFLLNLISSLTDDEEPTFVRKEPNVSYEDQLSAAHDENVLHQKRLANITTKKAHMQNKFKRDIDDLLAQRNAAYKRADTAFVLKEQRDKLDEKVELINSMLLVALNVENYWNTEQKKGDLAMAIGVLRNKLIEIAKIADKAAKIKQPVNMYASVACLDKTGNDRTMEQCRKCVLREWIAGAGNLLLPDKVEECLSEMGIAFGKCDESEVDLKSLRAKVRAGLKESGKAQESEHFDISKETAKAVSESIPSDDKPRVHKSDNPEEAYVINEDGKHVLVWKIIKDWGNSSMKQARSIHGLTKGTFTVVSDYDDDHDDEIASIIENHE